jgi:hypothetical protein
MTQLSLLGLSGSLRLAPIEGGKQRSGASVQCDEVQSQDASICCGETAGMFSSALRTALFTDRMVRQASVASNHAWLVGTCRMPNWNLHQLVSRKTE